MNWVTESALPPVVIPRANLLDHSDCSGSNCVVQGVFGPYATFPTWSEILCYFFFTNPISLINYDYALLWVVSVIISASSRISQQTYTPSLFVSPTGMVNFTL